MFNIFRPDLDTSNYIVATYELESSVSLRDAAWNLAIGQSVGNPNVRSEWETDELFEKHSCIVLHSEEELEAASGTPEARVEIAFPLANIDPSTDGISQLLCQLMGGQMDIDSITKCVLKEITFPDESAFGKGPKFGISGIRKFTGVFRKPLLGGIVKPKVGITPEILLEMVKEMVEGGINFIKEDEIMANPSICPIEVRVPLIMDYIHSTGKNVIYCVCVNGDPGHIIERVKLVHELGGNGVHVNFWSGLGVYKSIRDLDLPLFLHFQKSGDKVLTEKTHRYHIDWNVICKLAGIMGADTIHTGMWGGYMSDNEEVLMYTMSILQQRRVLPALSCGMHAGLVDTITRKFGVDYMANVGGALHGHPGGTIAGVKAMRQAIDNDHKEEYHQSIKKWGKL
jgi:ribulose-bisphosphate carboxylase large chain